MKTVLFVPGSGEDYESRDYAAVLTAIKSKGYAVTFVDIKWSRTTFDNWLPEFMNIYAGYDANEVILAGFSWGAMIAMAAAAERPPARLWLFSVSPYFAEDVPKLKPSWLKQIGLRRVQAFQKLSFDATSAKVTCPVTLFAGSLEVNTLLDRFHDAAKKFRKNSAVLVNGVGHEIENAAYIAAIRQNI